MTQAFAHTVVCGLRPTFDLFDDGYKIRQFFSDCICLSPKVLDSLPEVKKLFQG